jgi:hypothetical protein
LSLKGFKDLIELGRVGGLDMNEKEDAIMQGTKENSQDPAIMGLPEPKE